MKVAVFTQTASDLSVASLFFGASVVSLKDLVELLSDN